MLYGTLFMMAGAYALSRNAHVRGDFLYRAWPPRRQAAWTSCSISSSSFPACSPSSTPATGSPSCPAMMNEHSAASPNGPIVWPFKWLIPVVGVLMVMQGIVEVMRCVICLRDGEWPQRLHDVEELEKVMLERSRAAEAGRARRPKRPGTEGGHLMFGLSNPELGVLMLGLFVVFIMFGFPIAFTLMALGVFFGYFAMGDLVFPLLVQRTYSVMTNDVLISIPLFVFMGYIIERANILDRLFRSLQLAAGADSRPRWRSRRSPPARSSPPPPASSARWSR